jgi:hypothetical protein
VLISRAISNDRLGRAHVSDDAAPILVADNDRHDGVTDGDADYTATPRYLSGQRQVAPVDAAFSLAGYGFVRARVASDGATWFCGSDDKER